MSIITFDVFFYVFCNRRITDQQMKALCHYVLFQAIELMLFIEQFDIFHYLFYQSHCKTCLPSLTKNSMTSSECCYDFIDLVQLSNI